MSKKQDRGTIEGEQLRRVVADLADPYKWNWQHVISCRDAADTVLRLMAEHGIIEQARHPSTIGATDIWRVSGTLYGRTDGITHEKFDQLEAAK